MKIRTLIHRQGGRCFYCRKRLSIKEASIDHVIPVSMGIYQGFTNLVACCREINSLFQNLPPKHKIELLLNWQSSSPCPKDIGSSNSSCSENTMMATSFNDPLYSRYVKESKREREPLDIPDEIAMEKMKGNDLGTKKDIEQI